ncbi:OmpA family protein [Sphingomonas ginkgonis]|uniref:OmpA family protein n=1 Tax=Sphingomonas ginkgonis TaxID=2315330 RepID=A0A3R9Y7J1_9SPHN|nr:OmpA family protein [Sphingomonas ginkgonis]RST31846.1 OmpA family protein [Sphingomonas ginkgonis]
MAADLATAQPPIDMLFFDWGRTELRPETLPLLDAVAARWTSEGGRLAIDGYSDRSGSAATNRRITVRRLSGITAALVARGVPRTSIIPRPHGEQDAPVPTEDGVREVQNRRVELRLTP